MANRQVLCHHGIKGMKWGVRRFQDKNGKLTPAGKKRYNDDESDKPAKQSKYDRYYSQYKTLGYSDQRAEQTARGRIKTERALKIIGGVAVTALVAYGAYKFYDNNVDRFIKPNQVMQTVHKGDISDRIKPGSPFYASYSKGDNTIYASRVFSHFTSDSNISHFYTKNGVKAASRKTGERVLSDLIKTNPEVKEYIAKGEGFRGYSGSKISELYKRFNYSLVLNNDSPIVKAAGSTADHDRIHNLFYDALKKKGYGAVIDMEDSQIEGFTSNPVIVFDDQIKHVISTTKATSEDLGPAKMAKGFAYAKRRKFLRNPLSNQTMLMASVYGVPAYLSTLGIRVADSRQVNKRVAFVEQYRKDHPDTKLTNAQIDKMYYKMNS